jgi:hypothetical protein
VCESVRAAYLGRSESAISDPDSDRKAPRRLNATVPGRVMKVTFTGHRPGVPTVVNSGFDFPTSVTVCVPATQVCPYPTGKIVPPASGPSENPSPVKGPVTDNGATAGFG